MRVSDAHIMFKVLIDKSASLNTANFLDEEIDLFLSNAQEERLEQIINGQTTDGTQIEETQKRVSDLQSITQNANITTFVNNTDNKPNGVFIELPLNYRHSLEEDLDIQITDCNNKTQSKNVPVLALTHDKYNRTVTNPFSRPNQNKAYRLPFGRFNSREHFEIITQAGATPINFHIRYYINPRKIDKAQILNPVGLQGAQQMDMTDELCREIVILAVRNALGTIESPRVQEAFQQVKESE